MDVIVIKTLTSKAERLVFFFFCNIRLSPVAYLYVRKICIILYKTLILFFKNLP